MDRATFIRTVGLGLAGIALAPSASGMASRFERRRSDFVFTRLQYTSGNWDVDQRMPSNLLHSLVEYTTIEVDTRERIVPLESEAIFDSPFCYLSGHKLVEFSTKERDHFETYAHHGGFVRKGAEDFLTFLHIDKPVVKQPISFHGVAVINR